MINKYGIKELENSALWLTFNGKGHKFRLFMCKLPGTDINVFFVHNDWYFTCFRDVYPKWLDPEYEHERYIAFSLAVMEYAKLLNFKADVIHANDWHTAMIPVYLHSNYRYDEFWKNTKTVFEIHNLAYQGVWFESVLDFANMRKDIVYNEWGVEHYGKVNWMKGAINYSDKVIAVSPNYAREILTGEYGEGMDYTLRMNRHKIVGILNGIDYDIFNPKTDNSIAKKFDYKSLKYKEDNKKKLCEEFGLKYNPDRPMYAMVSRLVEQKGIDLIRQAENDLKSLNADFVFLGNGNSDYENLLIWLSNNTSNIRAYIGYRGDLANQFMQAATLLNAFKIRTLRIKPVNCNEVWNAACCSCYRRFGEYCHSYPLADSAGFKFWGYSGWDMMQAIYCSLGVYQDKFTLDAMRKQLCKLIFLRQKFSTIFELVS
ncbi:MAG: glycogen synthase [Candidatus Gastranaerophilaceae bacterium]